MNLFVALKSDKYFTSIIKEVPELEDFEIHHVEMDLQKNGIYIIFHTPFMPEKRPADHNYSAFKVSFFVPRQVKIDLEINDIFKGSVSVENQVLQVKSAGKIRLSFAYDLIKLESWNTYLNDI